MTNIEAKGVSGTISFDGERVTVAHNTAGTKVVPIARVSHAVYKRAGALSNGAWGVAVDGQVLDQRNVLGARAALDGNIVLMRGRRQREAFDALNDAVNAVLHSR